MLHRQKNNIFMPIDVKIVFLSMVRPYALNALMHVHEHANTHTCVHTLERARIYMRIHTFLRSHIYA